MCEWIPSVSFSLTKFPAAQLSLPWLMFTPWLIRLLWVMIDKQQLISTISTSSLRSGCALLESNLAPRLERKTESPEVPCFHAIFDLCLVFGWTLGNAPLPPAFPPPSYFHYIPIFLILVLFTLLPSPSPGLCLLEVPQEKRVLLVLVQEKGCETETAFLCFRVKGHQPTSPQPINPSDRTILIVRLIVTFQNNNSHIAKY